MELQKRDFSRDSLHWEKTRRPCGVAYFNGGHGNVSWMRFGTARSVTSMPAANQSSPSVNPSDLSSAMHSRLSFPPATWLLSSV